MLVLIVLVFGLSRLGISPISQAANSVSISLPILQAGLIPAAKPIT
jgi:hypothetical protein